MRQLTREEQIALAVVAVAVLAGLIWTGAGMEAGHRVLGAVEGVQHGMGYPPGHQHLARPDDIGGVIWGPHPLYCDPQGPGRFRDPLIERGWAFMSDPPSEKVI